MSSDGFVEVKSDFGLGGVQVRFGETDDISFKIIHIVQCRMKAFESVVVVDTINVVVIESYGVALFGRENISHKLVVGRHRWGSYCLLV